MKSLAASLLLCISANSAYDYQGPPPDVRTTDTENLVYLVLGEIPRMPQRALSAIRGTYIVDTKTIWLRDDFDASDPENVAHLVHELVHFIQYYEADSKDRALPCGRELEREAYEIQNKFLLANDRPGLERKLVQFSQGLSGCKRDDESPA
jgi:hypothetical protein